jgi:hypothetical protein
MKKEEQKEHLINIMKGDEDLGLYEEPQETLEQAAKRFSKSKLRRRSVEEVRASRCSTYAYLIP